MTDFLTTREVANLLRVSMSCVTRKATELGGVRLFVSARPKEANFYIFCS